MVLPKPSQYHYYIVINHSKVIRELKFPNYAFSKNLPIRFFVRFFETLWKDSEPSEPIRNYSNNIVSS